VGLSLLEILGEGSVRAVQLIHTVSEFAGVGVVQLCPKLEAEPFSKSVAFFAELLDLLLGECEVGLEAGVADAALGRNGISCRLDTQLFLASAGRLDGFAQSRGIREPVGDAGLLGHPGERDLRSCAL